MHPISFVFIEIEENAKERRRIFFSKQLLCSCVKQKREEEGECKNTSKSPRAFFLVSYTVKKKLVVASYDAILLLILMKNT